MIVNNIRKIVDKRRATDDYLYAMWSGRRNYDRLGKIVNLFGK